MGTVGDDQRGASGRVGEHLDLVLVDLAEQLRCEDLGGRAGTVDTAFGKDIDPICVRRGKPQIVEDHHYGCT